MSQLLKQKKALRLTMYSLALETGRNDGVAVAILIFSDNSIWKSNLIFTHMRSSFHFNNLNMDVHISWAVSVQYGLQD